MEPPRVSRSALPQYFQGNGGEVEGGVRVLGYHKSGRRYPFSTLLTEPPARFACSGKPPEVDGCSDSLIRPTPQETFARVRQARPHGGGSAKQALGLAVTNTPNHAGRLISIFAVNSPYLCAWFES